MTDHVKEGQHIGSVAAGAALVHMFSIVAISYVV
jgi:hypothetical protein